MSPLSKRAERDMGGKFKALAVSWTPERWDDGYADADGRFRVYRPDYPASWSNGYAFRYAVVYWLRTGRILGPGQEIHHVNEDRADDQFENLELTEHVVHSRHHNPLRAWRVCERCMRAFHTRRGQKRDQKYCSQACYHRKSA